MVTLTLPKELPLLYKVKVCPLYGTVAEKLELELAVAIVVAPALTTEVSTGLVVDQVN